MLTQGNLLSNAEALVETWRFTSSDVLFHALPIFHTHGLFVASNVTFFSRLLDDLHAELQGAAGH